MIKQYSTEIKVGRKDKKSYLVGGNNPLRIVAPFGMSTKKDLSLELQDNIHALVMAGVDAVQELSTYGPYRETRVSLIENTPVPYGTVLAYEIFDRYHNRHRKVQNHELRDIVLDVLSSQINDGVDFITVHAGLSTGLLNEVSESLSKRAIPVPSRAAGLLIRMMDETKLDNPLHTHFEEIAHLAAANNVVVNLGASFRPASITDAMDDAHKAEIRSQGELVRIGKKYNLQMMLEGLSHAVPEDILSYIRYANEYCLGIPVTALGPLPTDIAAGMDHIAAAIGVTFGAMAGLASINVISAKEHLSMPTPIDMCEAVRSARVGAYIAQVIQQGKSSSRDFIVSCARAKLDWSKQMENLLFPDLVHEILLQDNVRDGQPCTICGSKCPLLQALE